MKNYLFAYAINISEEEMHKHCPNAVFRGYALLSGFRLDFCGYTEHAIATLNKQRGATLSVAVWEMSKEDYYTIGNFEDFPYRYKRVKTSALLYGRKVKGEIYILKQQLTLGLPNANYLNALRGAYIEAGLNRKVIDEALARVKEGNK